MLMFFTFVTTLVVQVSFNPVDHSDTISVEAILQSFVDDFQHDPAAEKTFTFGIRVDGSGGGKWHVVIRRKKAADKTWNVTLKSGFPEKPTMFYRVNDDVLRDIHARRLNALTCMVKALQSDHTPMDWEFMPGFKPRKSFYKTIVPFTFHFWTKGQPEIIPFGPEMTRVAHGVPVTVLYYEKGFRSGWTQIKKGDHVNKDPRNQIRPFPMLLIGLRGKAEGKIDGKNVTIHNGTAVYIPANTTNEWWNPYDEPAEAIMLFFGDGA